MSKFQQLVESSLTPELNEGKMHDIGNKLKNIATDVKHAVGDVSKAIAYQSTRKHYLGSLTSKSSKEQLDAAHAHMTSNYASFNDRAKTGAVIAQHPNATSEQLTDAIRSGYHAQGPVANSIIRAAIKHPNADENTLKTAVASLRYGSGVMDHSDTLNQIINHPKASGAVLNHAAYISANRKDQTALNNIAKHKNTNTETLERVARDATPELLSTIANRPNVDSDTAYAISRSPNVSLDTLKHLSKKHFDTVSDALLSHKNADAALIHNVVKNSNDTKNMIRAALNNNTTADTLEHIAKTSTKGTTYQKAHLNDLLIAHPNTSPNTLRHLYNENAHLRNDILNHPNANSLRKFGLPKK